eukprot:NODE_10_length_61504_cov_0.956502.p31 type:complete len:220 gc:universal NODE_10_length_61504_cov_0.956502:44415-43756(-)
MESAENLVDQYLLNGQFQKAADQLEELSAKYAANNQPELAEESQTKANILKGMDNPPEEFYKDDLHMSIYSFWDVIDDLVGKVATNFKNKKKTAHATEIQDEEFLMVSKPHTIEDLQEENSRLVQAIHQYQERLQLLELAQEENQLLRSSIIQFKQEFTKRKQQNLFQSIKMHKQSKSSFEEDSRVKELESKIIDLQSELERMRLENLELVIVIDLEKK